MKLLSKNIFPVILLSLTGLTSCGAPWKTVFEGRYDGKPYVLQQRETKTFSSNRIDWRFRLGKMPAVDISALSTDWGPPWSDDIFGAEAYEYITDQRKLYTAGSDTEAHATTMLYFDQKQISEDDYDQYRLFMISEWRHIDSAFAYQPYSRFPHIIGLVYGRPERFVKEYRGTHEGRKMLLRIMPDGRVRLINDDKWRNENYSGLSEKVIMPGSMLYLDTTPNSGSLTMQELAQFRNSYGTTPLAQFRITAK